jgi:hypothetical protein
MHEMRTNGAVISPPVRSLRAPTASTLRAARTNDPFAGINLHSAIGRRIRDMYFALLETLPGPHTAIVETQAMAAAEAVVIAEQARQRVLQGDKAVSYDDLVRLDAQADRKVRRLGIGQCKPAEETFAEALAARGGPTK